MVYIHAQINYDISMKKDNSQKLKITNQRAHFDFFLKEHFEAGINLTGAEVKAIRLGHADLTGSFVKLRGNEAYLINSKIFPYKYARPENYDEKRTRKLLLHRSEIVSLKAKTDTASLTIVPVSLYTKSSYIKIELALGKPKKRFDKRETIKRRDQDRDIQEQIKNENRPS